MPCKHREEEKNANSVVNAEYATVIPLVFQEDHGMGCFYWKVWRPLADAFCQKEIQIQHNNTMDSKIKHNNIIDINEYLCFTDAINSMYSWES